MDNAEDIKKEKLNGKQKRYLKSLGHHLSPVVLIGKEGMNVRLIDTVRRELANHELIKIKIGNNSNVEKHDAVRTLTAATRSELVQLIGKSLLLFQENPEKPDDQRIKLP